MVNNGQGRTQWVILGLPPPLSLMCYKNVITCAKEINCFRIHCLLIWRLTANITEWICMQISRSIVNGSKRNNLVSGLSYAQAEIWVINCIQEPSHHFLQTFRPLRMFKIVFRNSSLFGNNCLYFVCCGWSVHKNVARAQIQELLT